MASDPYVGGRRLALLAAAEGLALDADGADAVGLLALVAGQDVEPGEQDGTWRIAKKVAKDRVISAVDPEARHGHKSVSVRKDGYKAHLAVEPSTGIVTAAALTAANAPTGRPGWGCSPESQTGSRSWPTPPTAQGGALGPGQAGHRLVIKPLPSQPAVAGGLRRDDFSVGHRALHRHLPGRPRGPAFSPGDGQVRPSLRHLPAAATLHQSPGPFLQCRAPRRRARRRPGGLAGPRHYR